MRFALLALLILIAGCHKDHKDQQQPLQINLTQDSGPNTMNTGFVESEMPVSATSGIAKDTQLVASNQLDIGERLKLLQSSLDQQDIELPLNELNKGVIQRMVFAARVVEVRQLKHDDTVVGTIDSTNSLVAELEISQIVDNRHSAIQPAGKIVVPTGRSEEIWKLMRKEGDEYVFEYFKLGNRETVWKFGC